MTRVRLSERIANAEETCARCENDVDGKCKLPVLTGIHKDRGTISTSKLISFSEDGRTCQLYTEKFHPKQEEKKMYEVRLCGGRKLRTNDLSYTGKTYLKLTDDWRTAWIPVSIVRKIKEVE